MVSHIRKRSILSNRQRHLLIINENINIVTTLGEEDKQIKIEIKNGQIVSNKSLLIHFPIPMKKAWDNVLCTCGSMLIFSSENEIDDWFERHNYQKGDIQSIENIWNFFKI